jgi:uncharacterized oxidoreductase
MPVADFIEQTFDKLATDSIEAIVDSVLPARANPGANEHEMVNAFNQSMMETLSRLRDPMSGRQLPHRWSL